MAEENEVTKKETIRLPISVIETVEGLKRHGIMGKSKAEVLKNLIRYAIDRLTEQEFVRKSLESKRLLKSKSDQ